ncbi:hypothetical protein BHM03_00050545 [Ensete ventricosum]|nr:hypothetical protein BHM03_00050545 [Ensete ventricosum]
MTKASLVEAGLGPDPQGMANYHHTLMIFHSYATVNLCYLCWVTDMVNLSIVKGGGDVASSQCCSRRSTSTAEHSLIDPSRHHRSTHVAHMSLAHNHVALPGDCGLCACGLFWSLCLLELRLPSRVDASTAPIYSAPIQSVAHNFYQGLLARRTHHCPVHGEGEAFLIPTLLPSPASDSKRPSHLYDALYLSLY